MTIQLSTALRNSLLDNQKANMTNSLVMLLKLYSGPIPADCATAASGTLGASGNVAQWNAASGGAMTISAPWVLVASANFTAGYFRLINSSDGTTVYAQGTISGTGGNGDLVLASPVITNGQTITITSLTISGVNP